MDELVEMLKGFISLGSAILLFGFMPGIAIGATFHEWFYDDNGE